MAPRTEGFEFAFSEIVKNRFRHNTARRIARAQKRTLKGPSRSTMASLLP
jgi:hypothetical protein